MTTYAGERSLICHVATRDDTGEALTPDNVNAVLVTVWDSDRTVVVAETAMTWDEDTARWEYTWTTTGRPAGRYLTRVRVVGADGGSSWEYATMRLKRDKAPA
jgi:hypothetical protein